MPFYFHIFFLDFPLTLYYMSTERKKCLHEILLHLCVKNKLSVSILLLKAIRDFPTLRLNVISFFV